MTQLGQPRTAVVLGPGEGLDVSRRNGRDSVLKVTGKTPPVTWQLGNSRTLTTSPGRLCTSTRTPRRPSMSWPGSFASAPANTSTHSVPAASY